MSLRRYLIPKYRSNRANRFGLVLTISAYIILAFLYHVKVPFFEKPDELKHFAVVQYIQTHRALPIVRPGSYQVWDQEGTQPPLYHLMAATATSGLNLGDFTEPPRNPHYADDRSFIWQKRGNNNLYLHQPGEIWNTEPVFIAAWISRLISILAGAITIALTYWLAKIIFVDLDSVSTGKNGNHRFTTANRLSPITRRIPLLAAALLIGIPQYLHVNSAITNDSLTITLSAATLVTLVLILRDGAKIPTTIILGSLLGFGAITKLSLLYLLPLTVIVLFLDFYRHRSLIRLLTRGLIISALILVLAGWWFWRNWNVYGDPTALNAHLLYRGGALNPTPALSEIWQTELVGLELSFWAAFGAGQVLLEPWIYELLHWLKYIILVGVLIGFFRLIKKQVAHKPAAARQSSFSTVSVKLFSLSILALWALVIFVALLRWMQITPASWGRLLYPALPAIAVLSAWGLSQFALMGTRISVGDGGLKHLILSTARLLLLAIPWLVVLTLVTLSLVSPFRTLRAAFVKTQLITEAALPETARPLELFYGEEALRLAAYRLEQDVVHPGEWLKMTLFWQATRPIRQDYSTFVHVLTPEGKSIAQANTYPDGGRWPTSMLPVGMILPATYNILIPPDVTNPAATRLAIGIFEFGDPLRTAKTVVNAAGERVEAIIDGLPITPRQWPALRPARPVTAVFGQKIKLIGIDPINQPAKPGSYVPLTLYWETLAAPGQDLNLFIHLIDPKTGEQIAGFDAPPSFPTSYWLPGTRIVDYRVLHLPVDLRPGSYKLLTGWYNLDSFSRLSLDADTNGLDAFPLMSMEVE